MSQSNFAYIYRDINIIVPGAFTPNGPNPVFLPRIQSANSNKFNMKIYNRWGKLVFETDNEFLGWDGKDRNSGEICLPGGYVYIIDALDSTGKNLKKVGSVVLLD
jgi:gliding motility-associated-like protein